MKRTRPSFLAGTLVTREQLHRRVTLLAIATLLVLGTSPVLGHHLAPGAENFLGGADHIGALCLTALHLLLAPVHYGFHVLLLAGIGYAAWDRARAWRRTRRALVPLEALPAEPDDPFWTAATSAGLDPRRVRIVVGLPIPALTAGLLRPVVYVAQDLGETLTEDELAAVLAHEGAHVARHDPLRLFVLRMLACTLFWIPALRRLADDMADEAEIVADDRAAKGRPLALATAILALARRRSRWPSPSTSLGFQHDDLLERRVRRLAGEDVAVRSRVTRRSTLGAVVALLLVWISGVVAAQPLPPGTLHTRPHCEHRDESAVAHLFCRRGHLSARTAECPHAAIATLHVRPLTL